MFNCILWKRGIKLLSHECMGKLKYAHTQSRISSELNAIQLWAPDSSHSKVSD